MYLSHRSIYYDCWFCFWWFDFSHVFVHSELSVRKTTALKSVWTFLSVCVHLGSDIPFHIPKRKCVPINSATKQEIMLNQMNLVWSYWRLYVLFLECGARHLNTATCKMIWVSAKFFPSLRNAPIAGIFWLKQLSVERPQVFKARFNVTRCKNGI